MQPRKRCYISKVPKTCTGPRKVGVGKREEEHPVWSTQRSFRSGTPAPHSKKTQVVGRNLLFPTSSLKHKFAELQQFKQMHFSKVQRDETSLTGSLGLSLSLPSFSAKTMLTVLWSCLSQ